LRECTIGIVGVGNIGKAVAKRLAAFGARVVATDPIAPPASFLEACRLEMVSKERLLSVSDMVSLHCDLNSSSFHILDESAFRRMRKGSYVINTARGKLIDEPELVKALRDSHIAGAAMDVFEYEPLPLSSPLRSMPNVLLAPHNSNSSPEAWQRVHENTVNSLVRVLCGDGS
jgi:D-3-phosphoglycerate dehydrogenase / 2-oxoglutarate reductase